MTRTDVRSIDNLFLFLVSFARSESPMPTSARFLSWGFSRARVWPDPRPRASSSHAGVRGPGAPHSAATASAIAVAASRARSLRRAQNAPTQPQAMQPATAGASDGPVPGPRSGQVVELDPQRARALGVILIRVRAPPGTCEDLAAPGLDEVGPAAFGRTTVEQDRELGRVVGMAVDREPGGGVDRHDARPIEA